MDEKHPAREIPFSSLYAALQDARDQRLVSETVADDLRLYCYTRSCVYDRQWNDTTRLARGLIVSPGEGRVVATPFPKFFNIGEMNQTIPALPFETFDKLDGSLIIIFHWRGQWKAATKGSFISDQARWATDWLTKLDLSPLSPGTTYLAEAIYPENRIVIQYKTAGLFLLAAYDEGGAELAYDALSDLAAALQWPVVTRRSYPSIESLLDDAHVLSASEEGFVVRFANGLRLKIKGEEYRRLHALVSNVTPLAVWEMLSQGGDLTAVRRDLPEEFWGDFDAISSLLSGQLTDLTSRVNAVAESVADLTDKEVGLRLSEFPPDIRPFIFAHRKSGGTLLAGKTRTALFKTVRPTGNRLDGYEPSRDIARVLDEATALVPLPVP